MLVKDRSDFQVIVNLRETRVSAGRPMIKLLGWLRELPLA